MSNHEGHRQRLRKRFREEGLDNFSDIQVLELILQFSIPRKDTNLLAHALLDHFGSLHQVLEAPEQELMQVEGIGEQSAVLIRLVTEVGRYYLTNRQNRVQVLPSVESCAQYLTAFFYGRNVEMVYLLCLDAKCKLLGCRKIAEGNVNAASISVRKIVSEALSANASSVVLAHNHPGGFALPSGEDIQTTGRVAEALAAVDITLADHVIVADDDYVSLAQSGYLPGAK